MTLRMERSGSPRFQPEPIERDFTESLQQRVAGMWKATLETLRGQSLLITILFFSVWGGVGFVLAVQTAAIYVVGRLVYLAWKERGLQGHIADQNHHIALLQQSVSSSAGEVARAQELNRHLQESYRILMQRNETLFEQNAGLFAHKEQLQLNHTLLRQDKERDSQMHESKLSHLQLQLKREQEKVAVERALRLAVEDLTCSLRQNIEQLQTALEQIQAERAQAQVPLSLGSQMNEHLARIGNYLSGEQLGLLPSSIQELLDLLQRYKEESIRCIRSQIELLPHALPARLSLAAIEGYLIQENQVLGQIKPLFSLTLTQGECHATPT